MPRPGGLHGRHRQGQPPGGAEDGRDAGRRVRRRRRFGFRDRGDRVNAPSLELIGFSKRFGALAALDDVSVRIKSGAFHALLGENGAGKSTLVKCAMGYYEADEGQILLNGREVTIAHPRQAHELGLGMVYQHFTLVPNMTVLENFVLSRGDLPAMIDWASERRALKSFLATTPFVVPLDTAVGDLAAGQKQKAEIL